MDPLIFIIKSTYGIYKRFEMLYQIAIHNK